MSIRLTEYSLRDGFVPLRHCLGRTVYRRLSFQLAEYVGGRPSLDIRTAAVAVSIKRAIAGLGIARHDIRCCSYCSTCDKGR